MHVTVTDEAHAEVLYRWANRFIALTPGDARVCGLAAGQEHTVLVLSAGEDGAFGTQYVVVDVTPAALRVTKRTIPFDAIESIRLL